MFRTTVYLPEELKARLEAEARRRGVTEAEVIHQAVDKATRQVSPRGGILGGGDLNARDIDASDAMEGFGSLGTPT